MIRITLLAAGAAILLTLTSTPAHAQAGAPDLTGLDIRLSNVGQRLRLAQGQRPGGDNFRVICDLLRFRAAFTELVSLRLDIDAAAETVTASSRYSAADLERANELVDQSQRLFQQARRWLTLCERTHRYLARERAGSGAAGPSPTTPGPAGPAIAPDAPPPVGSTGGQGTPPPGAPLPDGTESILDEAAEDINSTAPDAAPAPETRRTPPPVPPRAPQPPPPPPPIATGQPCEPSPRLQALQDELLGAIVADSYQQQYGSRPAGVRSTDEIRNDIREEEDCERISLSLWGSFGETDVPQTGIGVTRNGASGVAPETDAGLTDDKIRTIGIGGSLGFGDFRFRAGFAKGDANAVFAVQPISGGFNGAVFGGLSPSGSSGTGAGSVTLVGATQVELSQFRLGLDLTVAEPRPATRIYISFDYFRDVRRHDLSLSGTVSTVQFSQDRDQRVRDNGFGVGVGAETRLPLNTPRDGGAALSVRLAAAVQGYLLDSDLRSVERNISNFGPAADRDFTIAIDESESGFGLASQASAGLEYELSPGFAIFADASASYRSRIGGVFNPNSGDQVFFDGLTTALINEDSWSYGARIGLRIGLR